jgi:hypothetical protein
MENNTTDKEAELERVRIKDRHGQPYYNGVAKSGSNAPGVGKLHRARIEDGRVVEVECGQRAESWVPFGADSTPQEDRHTCSKCGRLDRVPGVEEGRFFTRVNLTAAYDPEKYAPEPL